MGRIGFLTHRIVGIFLLLLVPSSYINKEVVLQKAKSVELPSFTAGSLRADSLPTSSKAGKGNMVFSFRKLEKRRKLQEIVK
jgi:hypothetical protein